MKLAALSGALALAAASAAQAAAPPILPPVPYDAGPETFVGRLATDLPGNRVLNQMEIGARAFWRADYATAKPALDDAIMRIDSVFSDNANAAKASEPGSGTRLLLTRIVPAATSPLSPTSPM